MILIGNGGHAKVVRDVMDLQNAVLSDDYYFIAVGDNAFRKREAEARAGKLFAILRHPWSYCASELGMGTIAMAGVIVQPGCKIGRHVILNSGCTVDHDCVIEDYAHIAPGAHLCGGVYIGEGTLVGVGVGIAPNARIPAWSLVKARRIELELFDQRLHEKG